MSAASQGRTPRRMVSLARLVHPFPSFLVAALTAGLTLLGDNEVGVSLLLQTGVGMLAYQFAIGLANDAVDAAGDAASKPWKAIPAGFASRRFVAVGAAACAVFGLALTLSLGTVPWLLGIGALGCGLVYDLRLKRTAWSWLPYAVAFPLVPVFAFTSAGGWDALLWWTFPLGIILGIALHLANQAPDLQPGVGQEADGIAGTIGERAARRLAVALYGLAAVLTVAVLAAGSPRLAMAAAVLAATVVVLGPWAPRLLGRDGLFGLLALGSAGLALVFLSATR